MKIDGEVKSDALIVKLDGEVDHSVSSETREIIDAMIERERKSVVVFDLKKVDFMDSAGIGLIMGRYKKVKSMGGVVYVKNVANSVDKILTISGIYNLVRKI